MKKAVFVRIAVLGILTHAPLTKIIQAASPDKDSSITNALTDAAKKPFDDQIKQAQTTIDSMSSSPTTYKELTRASVYRFVKNLSKNNEAAKKAAELKAVYEKAQASPLFTNEQKTTFLRILQQLSAEGKGDFDQKLYNNIIELDTKKTTQEKLDFAHKLVQEASALVNQHRITPRAKTQQKLFSSLDNLYNSLKNENGMPEKLQKLLENSIKSKFFTITQINFFTSMIRKLQKKS